MFFRPLEVGPLATDCYLVGCEATKKGIVIDPGDDAASILSHVRKLGLEVKLIVATHAHFDHIVAVREVQQATGADFAVHSAEVPLLRSYGTGTATSFGVTFQSPPPPDRLLSEGEVLEIGDLRLKVLHTPGHSPGGICLEGHGVVFTGDTLFNQGVGRTDAPGCSHEKLIESIRTRLMVLPDATVVLPGHGPRTTIGRERRANPFLSGS
ncbi:MAG: MBL fold metallo-hydrolase [Dehalococcoidia bacterium]|nr:MBL fold metallo-hydrolase [Dehalococcoidia bacterium]